MMLARRQRQVEMPSQQEGYVPAPVGGLNTVASGGMMPDMDAMQLYNLVSAENGLRSRLGSREYVTGLTGATDNRVRTMLQFKGKLASGGNDRVFAVTSSGIWDVTTSTDSPTIALAFATTTGNAGYGVAHAHINSSGVHFLLYCDEVNGYHVYTEAGSWAAVALGGGAAEVSTVNPNSFRFVAGFKGKLLFAAADSQTAYYLGTSSMFGVPTAFPLAMQFPNGGHLVGIYNWTYDGGSGLDDALVFISSSGDVAIYIGTDLTDATKIALKGVWSVGGIPAGREVASAYGGDLLLLTKTGILPLSRLVSGAAGQDATQYATYKVSNLFNSLMLSRSSLRGWSIRLNPEDNTLMVTVPTLENQAQEQLVMSVASKSWSRYDGLGGTSATGFFSSVVHAGKLYFGTVDGRVLIHDGYIDGVLLSDPNAYTAIQWRCLTAFRNLGNGRQKQVQNIRPTILSETANPAFTVEARYRYDLREISAVAISAPGSGDWDVGEWDEAIWGDGFNPSQPIRGTSGCGVDVAIAIRGAATSRTIFVGADVSYTSGGWL